MITSSLNTTVIVDATAGDQVGPFSFLFKYFDEDEVGVKVRDLSDGSETLLTKTTHYSLSGEGLPNGGKVSLVASAGAWTNGSGDLVTGYKMYIYFIPKLEQLTRFRDLGKSAPTNIENGFDRLVQYFKGFFEGLGEVARSIKLPTNVHPDEFDPVLPSNLADAKDQFLAVNDTLDGFKMVDISGIGVPGAEQVIGAGGTISIIKTRRQHVRIKSDGGQKQLSVTPFGTDDLLLVDGMEIVVEGNDPADFNRMIENDSDYGYLGNGGIDIKHPYVVSFIYNATTKRFKLKSNGAW